MAKYSVILIGVALVSIFTGQKCWAEETIAISDYHLVGTLEGNADVTFAVFENTQTKQQKIYRIGDLINGATVVEIRHQLVVLKKGSEFTTVQMTGGSAEEEKPVKPVSTEPEKSASKQALERVLSRQIPPYSSTVAKKAVTNGIISHLTGQLQRYTEKSALLSETSFGKGIRASDLGGDLSASLGLDPNDVIVGISGMGIDSAERLNQIIEILNRAKVFNLSVIHETSTQSMSYERQNDQ